MENKQFYIKVNGQKVEVTEEVYRAYVRPIGSSQRKARRESRCLVKGERYGLVRCKEDCGKCPYYSAGNKLLGGVLSLDSFADFGYDEPADIDIESEVSEREENSERITALYGAIELLTEQQKWVISELFFKGKTQQAVAAQLGISQQAVSNILNRALAALKKNLKKF